MFIATVRVITRFLQEQDDDAGDYDNDDGDNYDNDEDSDDDDEPIEYLHGDLNIKIINARGMVNHIKLINYLEDTSKSQNSVDV